VVLSKMYQRKRRNHQFAKGKNQQQINPRGATNRKKLNPPQNGKEYGFIWSHLPWIQTSLCCDGCNNVHRKPPPKFNLIKTGEKNKSHREIYSHTAAVPQT